jgi:hypothetical protein
VLHVFDLLNDSNGQARHMLWRGCDGQFSVKTRPFGQTEQDFYREHPPTKPECCPLENRTYVCSNLRVLSRAAGSSGEALIRSSFLPLDLAARMCWPKRKRYDAYSLIKHFGTNETLQLARSLEGLRFPSPLRLTAALERTFPARDLIAAQYATALVQIAQELADDLARREVYLEDELALTPIIRQLEDDPQCHLCLDGPTLLSLQAKRSTLDEWSSSNKAIAKCAGVMGNPPQSGRVSAWWTQYGSWTGRITASNPPLGAVGADDFVDTRPLFRAPEGHMLISCDWRRAELQALAKLCRQEMHNTPAWAVFEPLPEKAQLYRILYGGGSGEEIEALPPLLRRCLKDIEYLLIGYNHGMAQSTLPLGNVPLPEPWCVRCNEGKLCALCGRVKPKETPDTSRQVNWMLQTSVAGAMRAVLPCLDSALKEHGGHLVLLRHDEIVVQVPSAKTEACRTILERHMSFEDETLITYAKEIDDRWGQWDVRSSTGKTLLELSK